MSKEILGREIDRRVREHMHRNPGDPTRPYHQRYKDAFREVAAVEEKSYQADGPPGPIALGNITHAARILMSENPGMEYVQALERAISENRDVATEAAGEFLTEKARRMESPAPGPQGSQQEEFKVKFTEAVKKYPATADLYFNRRFSPDLAVEWSGDSMKHEGPEFFKHVERYYR